MSRSEPLGIIVKKEIENDYNTLFAQTSAGYFALSNLNLFLQAQLNPLFEVRSKIKLILDFTGVKAWDISALLWLALGLQHYKKNGFQFLLRLPDSQYAADKKESDQFQKSADFLRRWRYDTALYPIGDLEEILVPEQRDYFSHGPTKYYKEGSEVMMPGLLHKTHIKSFS